MRRFFQWFTTQRLALIAFVCVTCTAVASTKLVDLIITNSVINSTTIGLTNPSPARFTYMSTGSAVPNPVQVNSSFLGWSADGQGETDFVNNHGTGCCSAFNWYTTSSSVPNYNPNVPLMSLSTTGDLTTSLSMHTPTATATTLATGPWANYGLLEASNGTFPSGVPQGAMTLWNITGGVGETDFVNNSGAGTGGYRWYLGNSSSLPGTLAMSMDNTGALTNGNGFHGNADTASQLNTSSNCAATTPATGIQRNGNANCGSYPMSAVANGYSTLPGGITMQWGHVTNVSASGSSPTIANFNTTFPHACFSVTVTDDFARGSSTTFSVHSFDASTFSVSGNNPSSGVYWIAVGN
jgi:hypothetical protein